MNSPISPFAVNYCEVLVEPDVTGHPYPIGGQRVAVAVAAIQVVASAVEHGGDIRQTQEDRTGRNEVIVEEDAEADLMPSTTNALPSSSRSVRLAPPQLTHR